VREVANAVAEVDHAATAIAAAMEQQSAATQEIARAVAETAAATDEVTRRIASVSDETRQTGARAGQVQQGTGDASGAVAELRRVIVRVVREAAPEVERRAGRRAGAGLPAEIEFPGTARAPLACRLADLSQGGAALEGPLPGVAAGAALVLRLRDGGVPAVRARILALEEDGSRVRLAFEPAPDTATRDTIARLLLTRDNRTAAAA
jgi:hypothetical protein